MLRVGLEFYGGRLGGQYETCCPCVAVAVVLLVCARGMEPVVAHTARAAAVEWTGMVAAGHGCIAKTARPLGCADRAAVVVAPSQPPWRCVAVAGARTLPAVLACFALCRICAPSVCCVMTVPAPETTDSDALLVERTIAGDQRAYELLVIKYQRRIERLVGRMVRDVDVVPDIVQETFLRAWRALPQFRGEAQFYTWLYRIAVNTAKKTLLDMKRDPTVSESALRSAGDEGDETSMLEREPIGDETPETLLAAQEIAAAVNAALQALPEDLRQAVTLREMEGLSYEAIATAMQCPIGTVRSRIFRAREAISARVKPLLEKRSGKRW